MDGVFSHSLKCNVSSVFVKGINMQYICALPHIHTQNNTNDMPHPIRFVANDYHFPI